MKAIHFLQPGAGVRLTVSALLAMAAGGFAQTSTNNAVPVVTVVATAPVATWTGSPGMFTVFRTGNTDATLNVWYELSGTASNGVDYEMISPHWVAIPAGATSNTIVITVRSNLIAPVIRATPKVAVLDLTNSPLMTPVNYEIGSPSRAAVALVDTNFLVPPMIATPLPGAVFYTPTNILIAAGISYAGLQPPTRVEFFAGTNDLGPGSLYLSSGFSGWESLTWTNPPPGGYALTAVASYLEFGSTTSAPVNVTVLAGPHTNLPPYVNFFQPTNGTTFTAPANIPQYAQATDADGQVTNVEFFAGTNDLGRGHLIVLGSGVNAAMRLVYYLDWTNVPPGAYSLTAEATDNDAASTVSPVVTITVLPGPGTNLPPVVSIFSPTNGATYHTPVSIPLFAQATDPDGQVTNVEFFAGTNDLGRGQMLVLDPPGVNGIVGPVYYLNWPHVPAATYALTAVATDNDGAATVSAAVNIAVLGSASNPPPVVRITSPPSEAVFRAPVNLPVYAYATDIEGSVTTVQFFANGGSLGFGQPVTGLWPPPTPWPHGPMVMLTNYWKLVWTNAPAGTNIVLTARATDNGGASTMSLPVPISILPPLPPPTNRPPRVSVVATDPIAIEGTNCWPWLGLANPVPTWSGWAAPSAIFRWITNCGPKNASFTVFRFGATNDDLNVNYTVGGTATNGIDYAVLPGAVLIPAGTLQANITVVPLDDGPPDINSTVVLQISPGTNYLVGRPAAAAAIILDSKSPHATTGLEPGNLFHLSSTGPNGAWFHVDYSTNLINWTPLCTNQVINGSVDFVDPDAAGQPARFYRTMPDSGPPTQ